MRRSFLKAARYDDIGDCAVFSRVRDEEGGPLVSRAHIDPLSSTSNACSRQDIVEKEKKEKEKRSKLRRVSRRVFQRHTSLSFYLLFEICSTSALLMDE